MGREAFRTCMEGHVKRNEEKDPIVRITGNSKGRARSTSTLRRERVSTSSNSPLELFSFPTPHRSLAGSSPSFLRVGRLPQEAPLHQHPLPLEDCWMMPRLVARQGLYPCPSISCCWNHQMGKLFRWATSRGLFLPGEGTEAPIRGAGDPC